MNLLISSIIQIILFSLIPFIWWIVTARKEETFFEWIGLKKISNLKASQTIVWMLGIMVAFLILSVYVLKSVSNVETATSMFSGAGITAVPGIMVYAFLNTSLPEEILFRGFLLKRLSGKIGFTVSNALQSIIFGLMHGALFFTAAGVVKAILIVVFTGAIGWCMGYVNEKKSGGSILPSWCIHAAANIFSGICSAFMLFQ